jgi:hypothetical protein
MNRSIMRQRRMIALAALAIGAAALATNQPAQAASGPAFAATPQIKIVTISVPMHLAKAVRVAGKPDAAGAVPVLLTDGSTVSVPMKLLHRVLHPTSAVPNNGVAGARPDITVNGSCGSSNIYLHEKSDGHPVKMTTGFSIKWYLPPAVYYNWYAEIHRTSGGYDYYYHASGTLAFRYSWAGQHTSSADYAHGWYSAVVDSGTATLSNGFICQSGDPFDNPYL